MVVRLSTCDLFSCATPTPHIELPGLCRCGWSMPRYHCTFTSCSSPHTLRIHLASLQDPPVEAHHQTDAKGSTERCGQGVGSACRERVRGWCWPLPLSLSLSLVTPLPTVHHHYTCLSSPTYLFSIMIIFHACTRCRLYMFMSLLSTQ